MKRLGMLAAIGTIGTLNSLFFTSAPAGAQSCTPLSVVGGNSTEVSKTVSPPSTGVTRSNWNTDFVVPSRQNFTRYIARVISPNGGEYDVQVFLKYNNDTADQIFNETVALTEGNPLQVQGAGRAGATPYQVNVQVGGLQALGKPYTVSAFGCY